VVVILVVDARGASDGSMFGVRGGLAGCLDSFAHHGHPTVRSAPFEDVHLVIAAKVEDSVLCVKCDGRGEYVGDRREDDDRKKRLKLHLW